jgi:hypothetical protein
MNMLPKDSLEFLASKFGPPPSQRIIPAPAEPKNRYYVQGADEELTLVTAEAPPVDHIAGSIETLVEWTTKLGEPATIWFSRLGVKASHEPGNPAADRCRFDLSPSPQLAYLIGVAGESGGRNYDQSALIRVLRTTLFGSTTDDLLSNVRKVNLQKGKTVVAEQQKGKVSMNRSDIAEMSGANAIPDVVQFDVPIFSAGSLPARAVIRCDLDLNAENERFTLTVLPGEIEKAWTTGETWLETTLGALLGDKSPIPLYLGTP